MAETPVEKATRVLGKTRRVVDQDEWDARKAEQDPLANQEWTAPWHGLTIHPLAEARYTPAPLLVRNKLENPTSWDDWLDPKAGLVDRDVLYILGAGASVLRKDLRPLDGEFVYGINWTLRWFEPTMLQIVDARPWFTEVEQGPRWRQSRRRVGLVSCRHRLLMEDKKGSGFTQDALPFEMNHPGIASRQHDWYWALEPRDRMTWYPNSLGWALNICAWFRPKRMVLLGFDFDGPHYLGDGKQFGSCCDYGLRGNNKNHMISGFRRATKELERQGTEVRLVGPTKLNGIWPVVETIEEALA